MKFTTIYLDTAIIGSGCAGFNAADSLYSLGHRDIAIITEGVNMGTSRNTGSDKQTYYKLSLAGDIPDSAGDMAADLYAGGGVNGDTALCEAAGSVRGFMKLCNLGVPFPTNEFGEYAGYKTDHDPRSRATSVGPLTSKIMTERLESAVKQKGIPILDGMTAVKLLCGANGIEGILCLDKSGLDSPSRGITAIRARQVILATGGPAICYQNSVYPTSQTGMSGMAFEAGAHGANLQEWQYGLASLKFRWNVSGTYQQVLPRYISVDESGREREFLAEEMDPKSALDLVFLKGYQWPFDSEKTGGSSLVDILVHRESAELGRRVFMDFRRNPTGLEDRFEGLSEETRQYLLNSGAVQDTPILRLSHMNHPAIELYRENGIDLFTEPLEIGVCAQHHNGGVDVDCNWQTNIRGLYAVGEAAGTFGARRPGGSALNSTQVGSLRAAEHIACFDNSDTENTAEFEELALRHGEELLNLLNSAVSRANNNSTDITEERVKFSGRMSRIAGHIREPHEMKDMLEDVLREIGEFPEKSVAGPAELPALMKSRDMLITQAALLSAMISASEAFGTRGGYLVRGRTGQVRGRTGQVRGRTGQDAPRLAQSEIVQNLTKSPKEGNLRTITRYSANGVTTEFVEARPIPQRDIWFERVWNDYRRRFKI